MTAATAASRVIEISSSTMSRLVSAVSRVREDRPASVNPFALPAHPPGVAVKSGMANDAALPAPMGWAANQFGAYGFDGVRFLGWTVLAEMAQRPEYRRIVETIAGEMVRKWIKITARGEEDKSEKVAEIEAELLRLGVRDTCRRSIEGDGYFGRGHLFLDFGDDDPVEIRTDVGVGDDETSVAKVGPDRPLKAIRYVEAMWVYPTGYDTANPLSPYWYRPRAWAVMGREVHPSRLLTFVGREVPDLLKAAYSFGGLPLTQMARPYVDNWLRARQSVSDLMAAFSVRGIKTKLQESISNGPAFESLLRRVQLFNTTSSNLGTMILDKEEEFFNVQTGLGTLDKLQAQAQEQVYSSVKIPLSKGTGLQPSGLNATSEGEISSFHDDIRAAQEKELRPNLTRIVAFVQLSLYGEVDPDIGFEFQPLEELSEREAAELREIDARTGASLIGSKAISQEEERRRVAGSFGTPYHGLDLDGPVPQTEVERVDNGTKIAATVIAAHEAGLTPDAVALKGLSATGIMPEITDDVIAEADQDPPAPSELHDDPVPNPLASAERAGRLTLGGEAAA